MDHEHDWAFAYAALAADQTFTAHYSCRICPTTREVHGLSRSDVAFLRPGPVPAPTPVVWTEAEARRLCFWQEVFAAPSAADQAPVDPPVPALAFFEQQRAGLYAGV